MRMRPPIIPITTTTPENRELRNQKKPRFGCTLFLKPQCGHASASELTFSPHSLQGATAIAPPKRGGYFGFVPKASGPTIQPPPGRSAAGNQRGSAQGTAAGPRAASARSRSRTGAGRAEPTSVASSSERNVSIDNIARIAKGLRIEPWISKEHGRSRDLTLNKRAIYTPVAAQTF
jgi:hypothetical protein